MKSDLPDLNLGYQLKQNISKQSKTFGFVKSNAKFTRAANYLANESKGGQGNR